jgi:Ca2+-binding EF-hand superfamily protein
MATKSGTVAERVVWMTRTSDVLGSHMKTDLDSYLTLIRRKIQEKYSTTAELINQIRRFKIGDSTHVTPNEFRYTLIKFGILLPQVLVDRLFNVFDSDRSGTMDFDEFATWIMNSEFRPTVHVGRGVNKPTESPEVTLQKKLCACIDTFPKAFKDFKKQVSFLEFISIVIRMQMPLTEREARDIFQVLDPKDLGYIESSNLVLWATTGRIEHNVRQKGYDKDDSQYQNMSNENLRKLVNQVVGHNTRQLEQSFGHIKLGQGTKLSFEGFRKCLLSSGVVKNLIDIKHLFLALGGHQGVADVDLFFQVLSPIVPDASSIVSLKATPTAQLSISRADRHLRDALRTCFHEVKHDIISEDKMNTGYISPDALYPILVKRCMPLSYEDFRLVVQQVRQYFPLVSEAPTMCMVTVHCINDHTSYHTWLLCGIFQCEWDYHRSIVWL